MDSAHFHFHDELNFFLPRRQQDTTIEHEFSWRASIKDMIEALGVPHTEIGLLVVNGKSVSFDYIVSGDDRIEIYPRFDTPNGTAPKIRLRPPYPGRPRFILDQHLGRLAAYLRMLGFDTLYRNDYHDEELAQVSHDDTRILLTRDVGLLKRSLVIYGYYVRSTHRQRQLEEIATRYNLLTISEPFKHCMKCNGLLEKATKETVLPHIPAGTAARYDEFHRCLSCQRIYWKGAHYQRMQELLDAVMNGH
ncbi:MAG: Mut7-C ubiquitin/RNAse domain-containing protein [Anaerolineaceae bacterium]|nr:Mut7-C ubiquitin/RNAse domain-containing protein [Anaerolineaceae bacterium]